MRDLTGQYIQAQNNQFITIFLQNSMPEVLLNNTDHAILKEEIYLG